jgi:hypothetical protein
MRILHLPVAALILCSAVPALGQDGSWRADPEVVRQVTERRPEFNYTEARVPEYSLPDPLRTLSGGTVRTPDEWDPRRREVLELFRENVYGRSPGRPEQVGFEILEENTAALGGAATLRRVAVVSRQRGAEHRFELILFLPNGVSEPVPVFLLLNNRPRSNTDPTRATRSEFWPVERVIARGYGIAAVQNDELAPDDRNRFTEGVIRLFEAEAADDRPGDAWGALAAWGWGASRAMDYLETDPGVDSERVALLGHSRGGKAALWGGAEDERFAMVISNESGSGGAALSRRRFGETVRQITTAFPHWFADNFDGFADDEDMLPLDQHMLLALIAPRALYVSSADEDLWADPRGEFLSLAHSSPVFALFGEPYIAPTQMPPLDRALVVGRRGYHIRRGGHDLKLVDWMHYLDFADRLWRR